jgi:hypothetical protein
MKKISDEELEIIIAALASHAELLRKDVNNHASPQVRYAVVEAAHKAEELRARLVGKAA